MNAELVSEGTGRRNLRGRNVCLSASGKQDQEPRDATEHQPEEGDHKGASVGNGRSCDGANYAEGPRRPLASSHLPHTQAETVCDNNGDVATLASYTTYGLWSRERP